MASDVVEIRSTVGALLIGILLSTMLSGTITMQSFMYYNGYPEDSLRNKVMVGALWLLDTVHTVMIWTALWVYVVDGWGRAEALTEIPWSVATTIACTGISTFMAHCFFVYRLHILNHYYWFATIPILLSAVYRMATTIISTGMMAAFRTYVAYMQQCGWLFTSGLSVSTGIDIILTTYLTVLLRRSRTGYSTSTDSMIRVIVVYTIQTGAVTCITTIACLVCWVVMPNNLIFLAIHFALGKLYTNSLLATLNTRKSLRDRGIRSYGCNDLGDLNLPPISPRRFDRPSRRQDSLQLYTDTNVHVIPRTEDGLPRPNDDSEEQKVVQAPKKPALEDTDTAVSEES